MEDRIVNIKLDKERPMLLTLKAIKKYHEITEINLLGKINILEMSPAQISTLLWVCLNAKKVDDRWVNDYESPVLSIDQVDDLIDFRDMVPVMLAFAQLIKIDMPESKESTPNPQSLPIS